MSTPVILRVHTRQIKETKKRERERAPASVKPWYENDWPELVLVLDCETTADEERRLSFATLRVYSGMRLKSEALVIGEGLPEESQKILKDYARAHREGDIEGDKRLSHTWLDVLNYHQFINRMMTVVYKNSGIITGFNLPADISRLALGYRTPKKGFFSNGFMFHFNEYTRDGENKPRASLYKPRIEIKSIGDGRPLTSIMHPIWDRKTERLGYIVDLQTMAFALTEKKHSLQSACEEFGAEHRKTAKKERGNYP